MTYADVLRVLEASSLRLSEVARALDVPQATASSRLRYLVALGFVEHPARGLYAITAEGRAELEHVARHGLRRGRSGSREGRTREAESALSLRRGVRQAWAEAALYPEPPQPLPATRGECVDGPRPCPLVRCRYHLALEVTEAGTIRLRYPEREIWELEHTCLLDLADQGPRGPREIARILGIHRERVRQILVSARANLVPQLAVLRDNEPRRRLPVLQAA